MGAINLETYDWADNGEEPASPNESRYIPGEEPLAETDNDWNTKVRNDLVALNNKLQSLESRLSAVESDTSSLDSRLSSLETDFGSHNHDSRYYQQGVANDRFVNVGGDVITGSLIIREDLHVEGQRANFKLVDSVRMPTHTTPPSIEEKSGDSYILE